MAPGLIIDPTSHQAASKDLPKVSPWRHNLTALSQCRNLYFVASVDRILIYQPVYPDQNISRRPIATLSLPPPLTEAPGYIDSRHPLGINHLIIRDLGDEEILLLSCDNGDVFAFFTRSVEKAAIDCSAELDDVPGLTLVPFFHENVGASAWGLDVHKTARLIAVSSNTECIVIFAFALSLADSDANENAFVPPVDAEDRQSYAESYDCPLPAVVSHNWKALEDVSDCYRRDKNDFAWTLRGHQTNIPTVAFWNNERRTSGPIYLTSADIDGEAILWEIWTRGQRSLINHHSRGWAVMCLDPFTARIVSSGEDTYGCEVTEHERLNRTFINNGESLRNIANNSSWHPGFSRFSIVPSAMTSSDVLPSSGDNAIFMDAENDESHTQALTEIMQLSHWNDGEVEIFDSEEELSDVADSTSPAESTSPNPDPGRTEGTEEAQPDPMDGLPFNIFMTSQTCLTLMGPQDQGNPFLLFCDQAVQQNIPPGLQFLRHIERLSMTHYIRELGTLVVGSQAGRVALLSMTYWARRKRYGFKIEAIVPFKSQEDQGLRPEQPLLGFAVSPVQGCQQHAYSPSDGQAEAQPQYKPSCTTRYRLLLMYYDHTLMTYEFHRPVKGDGIMIL